MKKILPLFIVGVLAFAAGCQEKTPTEKAIDKTKDAVKEGADAVKEGAKKTGDAIKDGADKVGEKLKDLGK
ncbi:hypothetical protein LBMAG56_12340 [Verrucomicrobiota bacterium]|nr:hypothetical protein LBMAG56_12340 [Verrucomicrobiota bacterium]